VLHMHCLSERWRSFLRILRRAADESFFSGRTCAAGLGTGTRVFGYESEHCRSFGLPVGVHHWHSLSQD